MTYLIIPNNAPPTQTDTLTPAHYAAADAGECAIVKIVHEWWRAERPGMILAQFYEVGGQWLDVPRCEVEGLCQQS